MKLAEALQERADLNRQIEQLKSRLISNVLYQEGEQPAEDPAALKRELDASVRRLQYLTERINVTNCATLADGKSLTALIAEKDALTLSLAAYKEVAHSAGQSVYRARNSEIRIKTAISVADWQRQIDEMSKALRTLDNRLQECNWQTELKE
jgi:hypothetical protein